MGVHFCYLQRQIAEAYLRGRVWSMSWVCDSQFFSVGCAKI